MGGWLPSRQAIVAETIAALIGGGVMWFVLRGFDVATHFRPSAEDGLLVALAALLTAGFAHTIIIRRRLVQGAKSEIEQRDDLKKQARERRERVTTQMALAESQAEIEELKPKAEWADGLIAREGNAPLVYLSRREELWHTGHLEDADPYFEIGIFIHYDGILRLIIGEQCSGRLSWDGREFAQEPVIAVDLDTPLPFDKNGPARGVLRLRQYVTQARRDEIKEYLSKSREEMEFWSKNFYVSLRMRTIDGELLHEGRLLGDYVAAKTTRDGWRW